LPYFTLINMNGRMYDPIQGRMLSPDNYVSTPFGTQGYNRYGYALNNPLTITDPDGEFIHIVIGAAIGGVVNLGIKAFQGKIGSFSDGLKAFGVGALAGGLGAATGGAALAVTGLTGASVAGGALAGVTGSIISSPVLGVGNSIFFGDPYSAKSFGRDVLIGGIGGGIVGGALGAFKGNNIWLGNPVAKGRNIWSFNNTPLRESYLELCMLVTFSSMVLLMMPGNIRITLEVIQLGIYNTTEAGVIAEETILHLEFERVLQILLKE